MGSNWKRRGQTWQDAEWRRFAGAADDLSDRARSAFAKLRRLHSEYAGRDEASVPANCEKSVHRTDPTTSFLIEPDYRGFA